MKCGLTKRGEGSRDLFTHSREGSTDTPSLQLKSPDVISTSIGSGSRSASYSNSNIDSPSVIAYCLVLIHYIEQTALD